MKNNRRDFLKLSGLTAIGLAGVNSFGCKVKPENNTGSAFAEQPRQTHTQKFNMSGYAAPKLDKVRIGNIGIGGRGTGALARLIRIEGVEIKALCDVVPEKLSEALKRYENMNFSPDTYSDRKSVV